MASQQVLFAETIAAMKKARKRKAYESDSDSEVNYHGNRGHKLQRRARFIHEGQLAPPSGPEVYKEVVDHAGYQRAIISRNPVLVDDEGYELDSDDDEEYVHDVAESAAEFNPYSNLRLENILAPLTSITDLSSHPTLSRPYTSKTLTELAKQACNTMHKENAALWNVKHLLTRLVGDHTWVPCELMLGPNDMELFRNDYMDDNSQAQGSVKSDGNTLLEDAQTKSSKKIGIAVKDQVPANTHENGTVNGERRSSIDTPMIDAEPLTGTDTPAPESMTQSGKAVAAKQKQDAKDNEQDGELSKPEDMYTRAGAIEIQQNVVASTSNGTKEPHTTAHGSATNGLAASAGQGEANGKAIQHSHQTNREGEHGGSRAESVMSEFTDDIPIHPLFLPPRGAHPDRDQGIPEAEAEDLRRLLQLYVQKQEEVCRGAKRQYLGLLRADRLRKTVLQWSKHEAHVGPNRDMSDGEDWYDKEEWGLEEDLKKGQDEEEEDTAQTTKKTRTRR
ncbi:RXT2-like protein [Hypoxylon cercidicola]|nr:RXT2-like protein [Hypoxylon cercidicola]